MKLQGSVVAVDGLSGADRDAMFGLMDRIYMNMRRDSFERDLDAKHWVIRLDDPQAKRLVGFSTQTIITPPASGLTIHALFSGDTVVDREFWGDAALASTWGNFALQLIESHPPSALYWFLISKGFRTYRYLPLFFREYYPRYDSPTPENLEGVLNALGEHIAPTRYEPETQIIRAGHTKEYLRPEHDNTALRTDSDPHVRYFVERNPKYHRGDELGCLAPLSRENFTPLAWRMIRSQPPVQSAF